MTKAAKADSSKTKAAKADSSKAKAAKVDSSNSQVKDGGHDKAASLEGEYANIMLLVLLYTLQGIPMGLFGAVNMDVKSLFKDSFSEQGTFMLAAWPFSLKLFWAPLVDSVYSETFGRRKTWMVPAQLIIGVVLLYLSAHIDSLFATKDVNMLTILFFVLYFLCATQDIAVDGWALTMLRTENAGYASTCNSVGQTVGFTLGFMIPMSKIIALSDFMLVCGTVFIATTVAVWMFKRETPTPEDEQIESIQQAYITMKDICLRPPVHVLMLHLFTRSLAFIPADVMAVGRLQDKGFPAESIATIKLFVTPLEIVMPWVLSKYTVGPKPLAIVLGVYLPRASLTVLSAMFAYAVGEIPKQPSIFVYAGVFLLIVLQGVTSNAMFVAHMAFFAKVSDPAIGGSYMTFLNTLHNIGNMWTTTFCLKAADYVKQSTGYDGFYALCAACFLYALVWFALMKRPVDRLQEVNIAEWRVS